MEMLAGKALTEQQRLILDTCPSPTRHIRRKGQLTRVIAAAGSGKTTTLLALAEHAVKLGHSHITYVTFTKAAAAHGKQQLLHVLHAQKSDDSSSTSQCDPTFDARTLHSCAMHCLRKNLSEASPEGENGAFISLASERNLKRWLTHCTEEEVGEFLQPCLLEIRRTSSSEPQRCEREKRCRDQVEHFIFKSLEHFCRSSWTLEVYKSGQPHSRDYYPAKLFHSSERSADKMFGFPTCVYSSKIFFYAKQAARLWDLSIEQDVRTFNFDMKRAQLSKLQVPGRILLVDESQDMDACQVDWIVNQQIQYGTHVYVVGDAAQSIYGFRGAKPQFLMQLASDKDLMLTESWRFGPPISNIANLILYAKEKSDQSVRATNGNYKYWIPYRTSPAQSARKGRVTSASIVSNWKTEQVTVIARSNATLLFKALEILGFSFAESDSEENERVLERFVKSRSGLEANRDAASSTAASSTMYPTGLPKIVINGRGEGSGMKAWKNTIQLVETVYRLFRQGKEDCNAMTRLDDRQFHEFSGRMVSWSSFCEECLSRELSRYSILIAIVQKYQDNTLKAMEVFQVCVLEQPFPAEDAHVILSTCHAAKGMEWSNVEVCDDFTKLTTFKQKVDKNTQSCSQSTVVTPEYKRPRYSNNTWQFNFKEWGDEINLLYVACTRAKETLALPPCICDVLTAMDELHAWFLGEKYEAEKFALNMSGCSHPLSESEADELYNSLVRPLRLEFGIRGDEPLKPELLITAERHSSNNNDGGVARRLEF